MGEVTPHVPARRDAPAKGSRWDISLRKWNSMRMDGRTNCRTSELERHMAWVPPRFYIAITPIVSIVFIQTNSTRTILIALLSATATLLTPYSFVTHLTLSRAINIVDSKPTKLVVLSIILSIKSVFIYLFPINFPITKKYDEKIYFLQ